MKNKKGISLIVLSITILVMAILAATAIIALEDSGIIKRSKDTVKNNNYSDELTRLVVIKNGVLTDNLGTITVDEYITELQNKGLIESTIVENADGSKTVTTKTGFEVNLVQNGTSDLTIKIDGYTQVGNTSNNSGTSSGSSGSSEDSEEPTNPSDAIKLTLPVGEGTEESPYLIQNTEHFISFASKVNEGYNTEGVYVRLEANIDLSDISNWEPIGNSETTAFDGIFEGNGAMIAFLNSTNGGVFGYSYGTIKDIIISNSIITNSSECTGALVNKNYGTITNVEFRGGTVEGTNYIGGVIGVNGENGNVSYITTSQECFVTGEDYVGGIIGQNNGTVTAATVDSGEVTGNSMVSLCIGQNNGTLTGATINWGTAEGTSIVGVCVGKNNGTLTNITINAGTAIADSIVGLFAGQNTATLTESYIYGGTATGNSIVGNFVGDNSGEITNCYTYSDVTADEFTGRNTGTISNCEVIS